MLKLMFILAEDFALEESPSNGRLTTGRIGEGEPFLLFTKKIRTWHLDKLWQPVVGTIPNFTP